MVNRNGCQSSTLTNRSRFLLRLNMLKALRAKHCGFCHPCLPPSRRFSTLSTQSSYFSETFLMNAFTFRDQIVQSYERFSRSFLKIAAADISKVLDSEYENGRYWPEPLIQINPNYKPASTVLELAEQGVLHPNYSIFTLLQCVACEPIESLLTRVTAPKKPQKGMHFRAQVCTEVCTDGPKGSPTAKNASSPRH